MKKLIIPVALSFLFLFSCETDNCECFEKTFDYSGDYPVMETEVIDCPGDIEDGEDIIYWDEATGRIDYIINKTCI